MNKPLDKKMILFTDDDPDDFYLFKSVIDKLEKPVEVVWVSDGKEIVSMAEESDYFHNDQFNGIIMLDLNMPGVDGKKILKTMKSKAGLSHIPIVIYTTSTSELDIKECYEMGANSYVVKPGGIEDMSKAVENLCQYWFGTVKLH